MDDPLRWGLLLDSWMTEQWKYRLVEKLLCLDFLNLVSVKVSGKKIKANQLLAFHRKIDKKIFKPQVDPMELKNVRMLLQMQKPQQEENDGIEVIIDLRNRKKTDDLSEEASFGVWSMVHFN